MPKPFPPVQTELTTSPFLAACRREPVARTPVWFMRQAGRSLPEYRALRAGVPMLEACCTPDLITEITLQPVRRHGVDAAILFSDIVVPLVAAGLDIEIKPGVGPVVARPVRTASDIASLPQLEPTDLGFVSTAVGALVRELGPVPLIGFAGAPFTLASYLVEGGPSKNHERTKALMYGEPELWDRLCRWLVDVTTTFLTVQAQAGASALQLFDSWAGTLAEADYRASVLPYSTAVFAAVAPLGVPRIHFGTATGELLTAMGDAGAEVVGVDWRLRLDEGARRVGPGRAVQGNLDPAALLAPWSALAPRVLDVLAAGRSAEGHIFNLGHGVLPSTQPSVLTRIVEFVHDSSAGFAESRGTLRRPISSGEQ